MTMMCPAYVGMYMCVCTFVYIVIGIDENPNRQQYMILILPLTALHPVWMAEEIIDS